jgi:hypothetical protein
MREILADCCCPQRSEILLVMSSRWLPQKTRQPNKSAQRFCLIVTLPQAVAFRSDQDVWTEGPVASTNSLCSAK